jgi:hypothetical protein
VSSGVSSGVYSGVYSGVSGVSDRLAASLAAARLGGLARLRRVRAAAAGLAGDPRCAAGARQIAAQLDTLEARLEGSCNHGYGTDGALSAPHALGTDPDDAALERDDAALEWDHAAHMAWEARLQRTLDAVRALQEMVVAPAGRAEASLAGELLAALIVDDDDSLAGDSPGRAWWEQHSRGPEQSSPERSSLERSPERLTMRSPERLTMRSPERLTMRSPERSPGPTADAYLRGILSPAGRHGG